MKKIDEKGLIYPPYISTSWKNVLSLSMGEKGLVIELVGGRKVILLNLDPKITEQIYDAHAKFLENESLRNNSRSFISGEEQAFGFPIKIGSGGIDFIGSAMQHNSESANMADLPPEVLNKIINVAKALGIDESATLPKPEPHCNCVHCQVAKALYIASGFIEENLEEEVGDEELTFKTWEIQQKSDKLYIVTNPLDEKELYNVYLGDPIGCTCGEKNCEHIKAVLNS